MKGKTSTLLFRLSIALILVLTLGLVTAAPVMATDSSWQSPATWDQSNGVPDMANAQSSNDQYATFDSGSDYVNYRNFSFAIPDGATIDGIVVSLEGYKGSGSRTLDVLPIL